MRRWLIPAVLTVITAGSAGMAARTAADPVTAATPPRPGVAVRTPVLSARRAPDALRRTAGLLHLTSALDAAFTDPAMAAARNRSCLIVTDGREQLYARGTDQTLIPASNMKLLTALGVLDRLGADTRLSTDVRADHPPAGGVVDGNLYLIGGGDPLLRTADYNASFKENALPADGYSPLERLAQSIFDAGVRHVTGAIVGDESRYDTQRYVPTWKPGYITDAEIGPMSALSVNGGFVAFAPQKPVAAPAPAVLASGSLTALLVKLGVQVDEEPTQGQTPAGAVPVASLPSLPAKELVGEMLRESDNATAELLTKELGHRFGGAGTTAAGVAVIRAAATARKLPVGDLVEADGSGLDRGDRASCALLVGLVRSFGPDSALAAGMPVAAESGTLKKRFLGTPAADRVAAKTGSLEHVTSLTGFVKGPGPSLTFSLVANDFPTDAVGHVLQDRVAVALAAYPDAPDLAALGPVAP